MANYGNKDGEQKPNKRGKRSKDLAVYGEDIPQFEIMDARCKVCKSTFRRDIDLVLTLGWSQAQVMRHWNSIIGGEKPYFNSVNISTHARKHLSLRDHAVRQVVEARARQIGLDVELATESILTREAVADVIVHKGLQYLQAGITIPEVKDILAAIGYLDALEDESSGVRADEMLFEFNCFSAAVQVVLGENYGEDKAEQLKAQIYEEFERQMQQRAQRVIQSPRDWIQEAEYEEINGEAEEEPDA